MNRLVFQVEFLSDIVLQATSNTQGNIEQLDFIAGSNFLGMVAQNYDKFEDSFKIFHSGEVKFGDGHILKNNKITYKMPLSFFHEKLNDKEIFNHHFIDDFSKFKQLKQKREGYITKDLETEIIEYNYLQKSAYNKKLRRSKDEEMYGYKSLKKGTKWEFCVSYENLTSQEIELIKESLIGKKRLGKSKSSHYGLVEIKQINKGIEDISTDLDEIIIYAKSRLALIDENGNPTYDLKYLFDGLTDENIDYSKCQIKTSTFTPYNNKRENRDYERICINKGSVIVLKGIDKNKIPNFIGAYQSEGFGEILINPSFVAKKGGFNLVKDSKNREYKKEYAIFLNKYEDKLVQFLVNKHNNNIYRLDRAEQVSKFIQDNKFLYKNITPSQWGAIRAICNKGDKNFKEEIKEYISNGVKKWDKKQIEKLLEFSDELETIKLLSIWMPKRIGK